MSACKTAFWPCESLVGLSPAHYPWFMQRHPDHHRCLNEFTNTSSKFPVPHCIPLRQRCGMCANFGECLVRLEDPLLFRLRAALPLSVLTLSPLPTLPLVRAAATLHRCVVVYVVAESVVPFQHFEIPASYHHIQVLDEPATNLATHRQSGRSGWSVGVSSTSIHGRMGAFSIYNLARLSLSKKYPWSAF